MKSLPWYRAWIYSINVLLIFCQIIFIVWAYFVLEQPRFEYIPIDLTDLSVIITFGAIVVQFFACFCAIVGVYFSSRTIVNIYWSFMIPLIIFDIVAAIGWAVRFHHLHGEFSPYLSSIIKTHVESGDNLAPFCHEWKAIHDSLQCCPKWIIRRTCKGIWKQCQTEKPLDCIVPLLHWMHSQIDPLAAINYFLLTPLKLTVVIILRDDILEFYAETFYRGNPNLVTKQWNSGDSDDEHEIATMTSSQNSRGSERSLIKKSKLRNLPNFDAEAAKHLNRSVSADS